MAEETPIHIGIDWEGLKRNTGNCDPLETQWLLQSIWHCQ